MLTIGEECYPKATLLYTHSDTIGHVDILTSINFGDQVVRNKHYNFDLEYDEPLVIEQTISRTTNGTKQVETNRTGMHPKTIANKSELEMKKERTEVPDSLSDQNRAEQTAPVLSEWIKLDTNTCQTCLLHDQE